MRAAASLLLALAACHSSVSAEPPDPSASPQAKAEPAPIANPLTAAQTLSAAGSSSAGSPFVPPPLPLRPDVPAPLDAVARDTRDAGALARDKDPPAVYSLTFALRASDVAQAPKGLELSSAGMDAARRKSEPSLTAEVTPGHARLVLHEGFVLPDGTELRIRADRFGYIAVAAEGDTYRVAPTGSLRAVLGEGLFDAAPTSPAEVTARGEGARRLGRATRHVDVTTRAAKASFELARIPDAGDGGMLLCRAFLDLMSSSPSTQVCADGEVPLRVELHWSAPPPQEGTTGRPRVAGVTLFDATALTRRVDVPAASLLAPPPGAAFVPAGKPVLGSRLFLAHADLAAMRLATEPARPGEPPAVLSLHNSSDELRYVWLDGVPLAWLAPGGRLDVSGVPHTRATVQWRTFLGDAIDAAETVTLPAMVDAVSATVAPTAPAAPVTSAGSPPR